MSKKGKKPARAAKPAKRHQTTSDQTRPSAPPPGRHVAWIAAGLGVLAFLLYFNTLGHGYVLDDPLAIGKNELVRKGVAGIPDLLTHHYRAGTEGAGASALLYRPLSLITFAIEWSLAPESPGLGHFMNALWYALTVALAFAALRLVFQGHHWLWAAGAALLFAVHPLHTEVVANIKSRDELLNLFFSLAALFCWAKWLRKPAGAWLAGALGAYFLALLSKESAVTLLPVFPLAGWVFFNKTARESLGHAFLAAIPVLVFLVLRAMVLSKTADNFVISEMDNPIVAAQGFGERTATSFMVLWKYLQLLVFPQPLLSDYSYQHLSVVGWSNWQALAGLAGYTALVVLAVRGLLRRQPLAFCIAAFLCAVVLYSQLPLVIGTLFGERLMYMPSLWFCAGAAWLIWRVTGLDLKSEAAAPILPSAKKMTPGLVLLALITLVFGIKTISRNPDWKNNLALFTADVAKAPNSIRLRNGMGSELYNSVVADPNMLEAERESRLNQIVEHANAAVAIRPNPVSYLNLGNAAISRNQYEEAIRQYGKALEQTPNYDLARINIGRSYLAWGRAEGRRNSNFPRSVELIEKALSYGIQAPEAYLDLGTAYGMMRQNEKAIPNFEKAVELNPKNRTAWNNLSIAYRAVGNIARAEECKRRADALQ